MNSSTNAKGDSLLSGSTFPINNNLIWDNVLNYNTYFLEITCDKNCEITINQCNYQNFPPNTYIVKNSQYLGDNIIIYLKGKIIGGFISFSIKNTSAETAKLYFSAVYK